MPRLVRFHRYGGPDVLQFDEMPLQDPSAGEIRIRVEALGLNRAEIMSRSGTHGELVTFPSRIGYEAAGTVEAIGSGVSEFSLGDRVATLPGVVSMEQYGVYGESILFPAAMCIAQQIGMSSVKSAAIWMQYLTAYGGLLELGKLGVGERVLITAASSSVGLAAIQIARRIGAVPIAATRSRTKADRLKDHGASQVILVTETGYAHAVENAVSANSIRVVFDAIGGVQAGKLVSTIQTAGALIIYGTLEPLPAEIPPLAALWKGLTVHYYSLGVLMQDPSFRARAIAFIRSGLVDGAFAPVIDRVFSFDRIVDAHKYMQSNAQFGKVVVELQRSEHEMF